MPFLSFPEQSGIRQILEELNVFSHCKKYGISTWQCPPFLFLVMGVFISITLLTSYFVGTRLSDDPLLVAFLTLVLGGALLSIAFVVTNSFERLAEANRVKSEFVSIVSHQLQTPLANMSWSLELLTSQKGTVSHEQQEEYLGILKENSSRMKELVEDLLTVSKIQEGTLPFIAQPFSFSELLKNVLGEFDLWIRASNILVQREGDQTLPRALGDPSRIRQALANLIENAIRYSKKSPGSAEGASGEQSKIIIRSFVKRNELRCEIEDNGIGIPQADQKYIFQKFFRSRNANNHETQGSGLGLYIAKSIVEQSGGAIGFASTEHKGSTFWFTLPIEKTP